MLVVICLIAGLLGGFAWKVLRGVDVRRVRNPVHVREPCHPGSERKQITNSELQRVFFPYRFQFEADYDSLNERLSSQIRRNADNVILCLEEAAAMIELPHSRTIVPRFERATTIRLQLCGLRTIGISPIVFASERQARVVPVWFA